MTINKLFLIAAASLIVGCANPPVAAPNQPAVVNDAIELTQQATNAYIAAKSGNTDYVYSIADGLRAYSTVMRTAQDVKAVLKQYSDGKSAGLSFIDNLAHIWTSSPLPPEKKAEVLAQAAEKAALGTAP